MAGLAKTGVALESHIMRRLEEEALARGVSRSRLISSILAQVLPQIRGRPFFFVQVEDEKQHSRKGQ